MKKKDNRYHTNPKRKKYIIRKVDELRHRRKAILVEMCGGKCSICNYNKCLNALEFHHRDPTKKVFLLNIKNMTQAWWRILLELKKCDLVCSNCHKEIHAEGCESGNRPDC